MSGVILLSRKCKINPDNVATPIAASLGDLTTLGLLSWIASVLYNTRSECHVPELIKHCWLQHAVFFIVFQGLQKKKKKIKLYCLFALYYLWLIFTCLLNGSTASHLYNICSDVTLTTPILMLNMYHDNEMFFLLFFRHRDVAVYTDYYGLLAVTAHVGVAGLS